MKKLTDEICKTCVFWKKYSHLDDEDERSCTKRAPVLRVDKRDNRENIFPRTYSGFSCGEWRESKAPQDETPEEKARAYVVKCRLASEFDSDTPVIPEHQFDKQVELYESALTAKDEKIKRLKEKWDGDTWSLVEVCQYVHFMRGYSCESGAALNWLRSHRKKRKDGEG